MPETIIKHVSAENLKQYNGLIKQYLETKDAAVKATLEEQIDIVAQAITAEESRAKLAEQANATASQNAQAKGEEALAHSEGLAEKVGEVTEGKTVVGMIEDVIASAYDDSEVRELISGLDTNKADKTAVAADKQELEGKIALKADQSALDTVSEVANAAVKKSDYDVKVKALEDEDARIAGLVATEAETARAAEEANAAAIKAISDDYLKKADKEELQGNIDTVSGAVELLTNGVDAEKIDGVNDLIKYVDEHGAEVTGMKADIKSNSDAIAAHVATNHDFAAADTALKNELNAEIAKKVAQATYDEAIAELEAADEGQVERITSLEQKVGSSNVAGDIAAAKEAAIEAAAEDAAAKDTALKNELNAEIAKKADKTTVEQLTETVDTKAAQADLTALAGRVTTAEGEIDTLQTDLDAVEAKASANETAIGNNTAAIALKASQADLEAAIERIAENEAFIEGVSFMEESEISAMFN